MFKDYLHNRSRGFQLTVFFFIWAGLYLITIFLQSFLIQRIFHISQGEISAFAAGALTDHPFFVIVSNALYSLLVFGLPAYLFAYLAHPRPAAYLGLRRPSFKSQWIWTVLLALFLVPLLIPVSGWVSELNLGEGAKQLQEIRENQINAYLKNAGVLELLRNIFLLALLPAFCEELFFRGMVQKFAHSYWKNAGGAIFISAFTFALMHMSLYDFLPIFLAGLVLAWVYQQTGSLWLNITIHLLFNGLQVFIAYYAARNEAFNQVGENEVYLAIAFGVGLIAVLFVLSRLYRLRSPLPESWGVEEAPLSELSTDDTPNFE